MSENTKKTKLLEDKEFGKWLTKWSVITVLLIVVVFIGSIAIAKASIPKPLLIDCSFCGEEVEAKECENCGYISPKENMCPHCFSMILTFGCPGCAETADAETNAG